MRPLLIYAETSVFGGEFDAEFVNHNRRFFRVVVATTPNYVGGKTCLRCDKPFMSSPTAEFVSSSRHQTMFRPVKWMLSLYSRHRMGTYKSGPA